MSLEQGPHILILLWVLQILQPVLFEESLNCIFRRQEGIHFFPLSPPLFSPNANQPNLFKQRWGKRAVKINIWESFDIYFPATWTWAIHGCCFMVVWACKVQAKHFCAVCLRQLCLYLPFCLPPSSCLYEIGSSFPLYTHSGWAEWRWAYPCFQAILIPDPLHWLAFQGIWYGLKVFLMWLFRKLDMELVLY